MDQGICERHWKWQQLCNSRWTTIFEDGFHVSDLDSSEHACGGHTEVQISYHLRCGRLVDLWRPSAREVVCRDTSGEGFTNNKIHTKFISAADTRECYHYQVYSH